VTDARTVWARDLGATAALALGARLLVALVAWNRFPPADDGTIYDTLADRLARGLGYTWAWPDGTVTPVAHYPVGYPAMLAVAYRSSFGHPASALVLHAVTGALGAACIHFVASVGTSRRGARWAGAVVALHPALLSYTPAIMTEGVASALLAVPFALTLAARATASPGVRHGLAGLAGVALGAVSLVRPQLLLLLPLVAWLGGAGGVVRRWTTAAFVTAGVAASVVPWSVRNERALGRPVLVSANGGWNLLIGTDPDAHGRWRALEAPPGCRDVWDEAKKDACFARAAEQRIAERPWAWLRLAPEKLAATFDVGGSGASYLSRSRPDLVPRWVVLALGGLETLVERAALLVALLVLGRERGARETARRVLSVVGAVFLVTPHAWPAYVAVVAVIGLGGSRRLEEQPVRAITCGVVGATALTHAVFFGAGRYGLLVVPWVAAAAVVGLAALLDPRDRPRRSVALHRCVGRPVREELRHVAVRHGFRERRRHVDHRAVEH